MSNNALLCAVTVLAISAVVIIWTWAEGLGKFRTPR